jgi:hypothetical protein
MPLAPDLLEDSGLPARSSAEQLISMLPDDTQARSLLLSKLRSTGQRETLEPLSAGLSFFHQLSECVDPSRQRILGDFIPLLLFLSPPKSISSDSKGLGFPNCQDSFLPLEEIP